MDSAASSFRKAGPWPIVMVGFINMVIGQGIHQSFPIFYVAILQDLGWSRAATAGIFSLSMIVVGFSGPLVSFVLERQGFRRGLTLGALCLAAGLLMFSLVRAPWQMYAAYGLVMAFGTAMLGVQAHGIVVAQWYTRLRGTALAITLSGIGVGVFLLAPLSQWLINALTWRGAAVALAVLAGALALPNLLYMADPPSATPVKGSGRAEARAENAPKAGDGLAGPSGAALSPWRLAWRIPAFWWFSGSFFFVGFSMFAVSTHQAAYLVDMGYDPLIASGAVAALGIASFVGRLVFGAASDRWGRVPVLLVSFALSATGIACLLAMLISPSPLWIYVYVGAFGLGFGSRGPILAALGAEKFLGPHFTVIWGLVGLGTGLGNGVGPWVAGLLYDITGSYQAPFALAFVCIVAGAVCSIMAARARPMQPPTAEPEPVPAADTGRAAIS